MPDLIAKPALGHAPLTHAATSLAEAEWTPVHSIAPFPGQEKALAKALKPLGLAFPAPNSWSEKAGARLVWAGRDLAFLIGAEPPAALPAAITDQSDAWVTLTLSGPQARAVLARLVPLDLRAAKAGQAARCGLNHLPLILICEGPDSFRLMTFRSMARTAWHELQDALIKIEARLSLT
ncbi:sarcosine oxidase subunit gamma [Pseudotabrizicola sp. L79]|uniref:sarcosine oxidase subunit gamma n=1 Tax=Pseudotabrizicola sp. L79 TaxID=3118402 RepID=UPI002F92D8DF